MNVTMHWTGKDRQADPAVRVEHFDHNKDTPKRLSFFLGDQSVEIWTNGAGLKMIADAIADHPKELEREAKAALEEAEKRYRQLGGVTVESGS